MTDLKFILRLNIKLNVIELQIRVNGEDYYYIMIKAKLELEQIMELFIIIGTNF